MACKLPGIKISSFLFNVSGWECHVCHLNLDVVPCGVVVHQPFYGGIIDGYRCLGDVPASAEPCQEAPGTAAIG